MPESIIVYRDGVSDGQFQQVIDIELPAIKLALDHQGYPDVKVTIMVCQKRHQTRLCYQDGSVFINSCPGLVVDSTGGKKSIVSAKYNEFYLNSHAALLGTARPCKYIILYDEIGFKLSEIELLTYWTCYLYCRATKSVSYATPAYYAHWASKRAKALFAAGGTAADLDQITNKWMNSQGLSPMFFV
jgi:eukaryotic translation initiation factor 2C